MPFKLLCLILAAGVIGCGCYPEPNENPQPQPSEVEKQDLITATQQLLKASNMLEFAERLRYLQDFARINKATLNVCLQDYSDFYLNPKDYDKPLKFEEGYPRTLIYLAGHCGYADLVKEYYSSTCHESVLYALAESNGLLLYYNFVEGGRLDRIVSPEQARDIISRNGLVEYCR